MKTNTEHQHFIIKHKWHFLIALVLLGFAVFILVRSFLPVLSGDNKNSSLFIMITKSNAKIEGERNDYAFKAIITNENGEELITRNVKYIEFDNNGDLPDKKKYGKCEISYYEFRTEEIEESRSFFIFSGSKKVKREVLHINAIKCKATVGINIKNEISELSLGKEHQFKFDYYPKEGYSLSWFVFSDDVLTVTENGLVKSIDYGFGRILARIEDSEGHIIFEKDIYITVPLAAERIELEPVYDSNIISMDDYTKSIHIKYFPKKATNTKYEIIMDNPILEIQDKHEDTFWVAPLKTGEVIVTVVTDNGVSSSIKLKVVEQNN